MKAVYFGVATLFEGYELMSIGDIMLLARSPSEAEELGESLYFTGICKNGHLAVRDTNTSKCLKCSKLSYEKWLDKGGKVKRADYQRVSYLDKEVKIRKVVRNQLYRVLEHARMKKYGKTFDILGYSAEDFSGHIESLFTEGMTWENYGFVWEIDHIKPVASFEYTTMEDVARVNQLDNLQPMFKTDHKAKTIIDIVTMREAYKDVMGADNFCYIEEK